MRRLGVDCLPPDINRSEADFSVEEAGEGLAVRYALGALKGVGEKAMALLVEEREAKGRFAGLDDFAHRVDPRLLNKRQLETLAGAGAFDSIDPDRAGIHAAAETILAVAQRTHENRTSGQGGLFGEADTGGTNIQLPTSVHWSLGQRIEAEKESFGYFFSAHPLDRYAHLARVHAARSIATLGEVPLAEGGRTGATIAALVEEARWRTSARGRRYLMATISDASGQTVATCFDDLVARDLEEAARAGGCGVVTVELDRRPGEEAPRVTIKRLQRFEALASTVRLVLELSIDAPETLPLLAALIANQRGGRGEVRVRVAIEGGGEAELLLGRDFQLDAELAARAERLPGVRSSELRTAETPRLALVG
jgi:DNA polymerase-3 subunit alpha